MEYRLNKDHLLDVLEEWNRFLKRKVHLIACGGTAMTLSGVKPSTKDVDFMVPNIQEHQYLIKQLRALEYNRSPVLAGSAPGRLSNSIFFMAISSTRQSC